MLFVWVIASRSISCATLKFKNVNKHSSVLRIDFIALINYYISSADKIYTRNFFKQICLAAAIIKLDYKSIISSFLSQAITL
jgi:hypothetical protein